MKVVLPEKKVFNKKQIAFYVSIIVICIISLIIAFYVQFYARIDIGRIFGLQTETEFGNKTEEQVEMLKTQFDQIFNNNIINVEGQENKKKEKDKPLVYAKVEKKETKMNAYDIEVHIPYINIDNEIVEKYNQEINQFVNKTNSIIESQSVNTIYNVNYTANIYDGIVSLIISSNLKEGNSAQRAIIETFNYDLRNNKEITLEEVLKIEHINKGELQEKIKNEIETEQKKVEDLKDLGYNVYSRDVTSNQYEIKNTNEFYLTNNTLYIIYPYGNNAYTSERDLIIV